MTKANGELTKDEMLHLSKRSLKLAARVQRLTNGRTYTILIHKLTGEWRITVRDEGKIEILK